MRTEARRLVRELFQLVATNQSNSIEPADFAAAVEHADLSESPCPVAFFDTAACFKFCSIQREGTVYKDLCIHSFTVLGLSLPLMISVKERCTISFTFTVSLCLVYRYL